MRITQCASRRKLAQDAIDQRKKAKVILPADHYFAGQSVVSPAPDVATGLGAAGLRDALAGRIPDRDQMQPVALEEATMAMKFLNQHSSSPGLDHDVAATRRAVLMASLFAGLPAVFSERAAFASKINPSETIITLPDAIHFVPWSGAPPHSAEMATLYGSLDKPGPYLVLMKWYPGYMSAPHSYRTDRLSIVLSGTWWVNSGADFDPDQTVPVPAGGFVRRVAHTPHYDGVKSDAKEPAVIALFGIAPVDLKLVDPSKPGWRKV